MSIVAIIDRALFPYSAVYYREKWIEKFLIFREVLRPFGVWSRFSSLRIEDVGTYFNLTGLSLDGGAEPRDQFVVLLLVKSKFFRDDFETLR